MPDALDDLAGLWDICVSPGERSAGIGLVLFRAAAGWAGACSGGWLKIETPECPRGGTAGQFRLMVCGGNGDLSKTSMLLSGYQARWSTIVLVSSVPSTVTGGGYSGSAAGHILVQRSSATGGGIRAAGSRGHRR